MSLFPGTELLKPLKFSDKGDCNIFCSREPQGWGMVTEKPWLDAYNFQPHTLTSREGRGAGDGVNRQWPMMQSVMSTKRNPHNTSKQQVCGASELVNTPTCQEGSTPQFHEDKALVLGTLPELAPCASLYVCSLVSFIINCNNYLSIFLSTVNLFSKLFNQRRVWSEPKTL